MTFRRHPPCALLALAAASFWGCSENAVSPADDPAPLEIDCSIPLFEVHRGATRGAIPALSNPDLVFFGERGSDYLQPDTRVVGVILDGQPVAIPHNIFWWHEIVNFDTDAGSVAVTHCPLTGSTLAFDRGPVDGADFDVSGLLYQNNLMMVDESADESLWPQMGRTARCGPRDGQILPMLPALEATWERWMEMYPYTRVVSRFTGYARVYDLYPYDDYDDRNNDFTLFPVSTLDERRPPKERALGIPDGSGGVVFPFGELAFAGRSAAVHGATADGDFVVFWDRDASGANAYRPTVAGEALTFRAASGRIFDWQTGSEWRLDGRAVSGPMEGEQLEPVAEAFVAFWFAWPLFYPDVTIWTR